jgi:hypothetical protein
MSPALTRMMKRNNNKSVIRYEPAIGFFLRVYHVPALRCMNMLLINHNTHVIGANGFVGGHILKALLKDGFKVKAVVGTRNEEMKVKRLCAGSEERVQVVVAGGIVGDKSKDVVRGVSGVCSHVPIGFGGCILTESRLSSPPVPTKAGIKDRRQIS